MHHGDRYVFRIALAYSLAGLVIGAAGGYYGVVAHGLPKGAIWLGGAAGWLFTLTLPLLITGVAGRLARSLYNPTGRSTPPEKQHSFAESLVARGMYAEAVSHFERAVAEDPADPHPYLRIARIHRDHTGRPEEAARWFRRATREATMSGSLERLVRRELVELYAGALSDPERAAPELARIAEGYPGTPEGRWAAEELLRVKDRIGRGGRGRRVT